MEESKNLSKVYDPQSVEEKWYKWWEESKFFSAKMEEGKPAFSIVMRRRMSPVCSIWTCYG